MQTAFACTFVWLRTGCFDVCPHLSYAGIKMAREHGSYATVTTQFIHRNKCTPRTHTVKSVCMQAQVPVTIEEQRVAAPQVHLISHKDELNMQAPLVVATLRAILGFSDAAFRRHLKEFFPILTQLISCEHAPTEVQRTLTEIFATRFGPLLQGS